MKKRILLIIMLLNIVLINTVSFATEIQEVVDSENSDSLVQNTDIVTDELGLNSTTAVLMEMKTGKVLYDKDMKKRMFPASLTKVLTAILVLENCDDLNKMATASEYAVMSITDGYTTAGIKVGESFTIEQLLEVMMLRSANEAATILAEYVSGSVEAFSKLMNEKAKEIGCLDSNFLNANGMHDENHYSTAYDMALIEQYCMKNEDFRRISGMTICSLPNTTLYEGDARVFKNTHAFLLKDNKNYYEYAIAGKTGYTTPAKNCLITCSNKDGLEFISVILHAEGSVDGISARYSDTRKLLDYGYNNYRISKFMKKGSIVDDVEIELDNGKKEELNLILEDNIEIICKKNESLQKDDEKIKLNDLKLPISKGDILGTVIYTIDGVEYEVQVSSDRNIELTNVVKEVNFEKKDNKELIAIILLFGLIIVLIVLVILFIIVGKKERTEKLNFNE